MPKVIDCITYFDEDMLLDFRFNVLNDYVSKFVIVEAKEDHQGNKKSLNFDFNNFPKFRDKIIYIIQEKLTEDQNTKLPKNWSKHHLKDQSQRNYILNGLKKFDENDWIIISDLDEIPNPKVIKNFNPKFKYSVFEQKFFYYKFNLIFPNQNWYGSRICIKNFLKSPQWLRNQKVKKKFIGIFDRGIKVIKNGGWHFSYLKTPAQIRKKIESFAHSEFNKDEYKNLKNIEDCILNHTDLYDRNSKLEKISITNELPLYLSENVDKYANWIVK
tara:strand:- start:138 stop:953 length:816 start_codon:yes stop_codon:yes gene_type:complete